MTKCPKCFGTIPPQPMTSRCPTCAFDLPPDWQQGHATCIAMAGASATGKSVFIGVLVKQLQSHLESVGRVLQPLTPQVAKLYTEHYEKPLFEQRQILTSTRRADIDDSQFHTPLIFTLGVWNNIPRFLVIRDVAGEDLEKPQSGSEWEFFSRADGVMFMFDPLRVQVIADHLRGLIPWQAIRGDPRHVLNNVMNLIGPADPRLAIILSKFDVLQSLQQVEGGEWKEIMSNLGAAFSRDFEQEGGAYNEADGMLLHLEVNSLLQKLEAGPLFTTISHPQTSRRYRHRYFAVSALGAAPNGQSTNARGISPFRCLDPVRWILWENGVTLQMDRA